MDVVHRIRMRQVTNDDYELVMRLLGFEIRPHAKMYGGLSCRRIGSTDAFRSVPNLASADDADLWLRSQRLGQFTIEATAAGGRHVWTAKCQGRVQTSPWLGAAMWAAFVAARL